MSVERLMFSLIQDEICLNDRDDRAKEVISSEVLPSLFKLSNAHDMAHIVSNALAKRGFLGTDEISEKFRKCQMIAVLRYERINYEYKIIVDALENGGIAFIPLKGSVLREYYPEPWMRTSCDIDIFIQEAELERAIECLCAAGCKCGARGDHDVALRSSGGVSIELHFDLVEDGRANRSHRVLESVWDHAFVKAGYKYWYELDSEMFWFYHIAHMAKHFEIGGCGIRPFLDMWILENRTEYEKDKIDTLLEQGGLLKFASCCEKLSRVWFDGEEPDSVSLALEEYVLRGGVYGSVENRVAATQNREGGRFKYILSRIFLPLDTMKAIYPLLKKHKWLLPIMHVRRWIRIVFRGRAKVAVREFEINRSMPRENIDRTEELFKDIGLG